MEIKMAEKSLKRQIREMEAAKRDAQAAPVPEKSLSFDEWWILLQKRTPLRPHLKEIIWADFNARGLKKQELATKYDEGLKLFGL
jgi:hypothetical protein